MRLSIVTPTLNEEQLLGPFLRQVQPIADEVWISDGGSRDQTVALAEKLGAGVVRGPAGRGIQLNRGARSATGEILLFLHADSRLPPNAAERIRAAVSAGAVGGGFRVHFDDDSALFKLGSAIVNLRTRLTGCPLGDQGQFVSRTAFDALGGFRDWPILEDLDFARRMRRLGATAVIDSPVTTSVRRFRQLGIARTIATNWLIFGLFFAGVSPVRLARLYRHIR